MAWRPRHFITALVIKIIQRLSPSVVKIEDRTFYVSKDVFNPRYYITSQFMAQNLDINEGGSVLDMGTGSGIQAIFAAEKASRVIGIDINPEAVKIAKENVRLNGLEGKIEIMQGDLFSPLKKDEKFHVIIFTPPYLEGSINTPFDHAIFDPGKSLIQRFFKNATDFLHPDGYILLLYSSLAQPGEVLKIASSRGWQWQIIAIKKMTFETFIIYKFTRRKESTA